MKTVQKIESLDVQPNILIQPIKTRDVISTVVSINGGSKKAGFRKFAAEGALQSKAQIEQSLSDQLNSGFLEKEIKVKKTDPNTFIHKAILENAPEVLAFLLKHKADVDYPDANGMSPLTIAILSQQPKIVKLLLENGANVSPEKKWKDMSLLEISMTAKDIESMQHLILCGADVNAIFKNEKTPVEIAGSNLSDSRNVTMLNLLVDSNRLTQQELDRVFQFINSLHSVVQINNAHNLCEKLIQKGANVNANCGEALVNACKKNDLIRIKMLLANGANPNLCPPNELSPLMGASNHNLLLMKMLLEFGANPNQIVKIKYADGREEHNALIWAIYSLEGVKLLVEAGADIVTKINGKTPLEYAFEKGSMDVVKYLLEQISKD